MYTLKQALKPYRQEVRVLSVDFSSCVLKTAIISVTLCRNQTSSTLTGIMSLTKQPIREQKFKHNQNLKKRKIQRDSLI